MFTSFIALLIFAGFVWFLYSIVNARPDNGRPRELINAKVVLIEGKMQCAHRHGVLTGRYDRVYQLPNGEHVPMEFKNKNDFRVHETDIAQLSLQTWLLRSNGIKTTSHGYVMVQNRTTKKRQANKVNLFGDRKCEELIDRYVALRRNNSLARKDRGPKCRTCGHYSTCMHACMHALILYSPFNCAERRVWYRHYI